MTMAVQQKKKHRREGVYVLLLVGGERYYVGASSDIDARVSAHITDPKVAWVTANGGVQEVLDPVTPFEEPISAWEMRETMARMIMHGFNNVRGWEYCSPSPLGSSDVDGIFKLMCGGLSSPLCHTCGFSGHLSSACTTTGRAKWLGDLMACRPDKKATGSDVILDLIREGGVVPQVGQKRKTPQAAPKMVPMPRPVMTTAPEAFVSYNELSAPPRQQQRGGGGGGGGCTRCGRLCHTIEGCYARTSADGVELGRRPENDAAVGSSE